MLVLGYPEYYGRFGFVPAKRIKVPFEVPEEVFLVKENMCRALEGVEGKVIYPKAFLDLI